MARLYDQYVATMQKIADVENTLAVMSWDKEVNLPPKGAEQRSRQMATLSSIAHEMFTDIKFGRILKRLSTMASLAEVEKRNIKLTLSDYNKATKFSTAFIIKKSHAISAAYHAWIQARKANNYNLYKVHLQTLIDIKREEAKVIGFKKHPYDALLDQYEPRLTVDQCDKIFNDVKKKLPAIINLAQEKKNSNKFLRAHYPKDTQWNFGLSLLKNLGYDFEAGRQDISTHPFTTSFGPQDVRVTTRIDEGDFTNMTWSCIHEGGHGLYEQGLPSSEYGLPSGSAISLGIHESQSRLWENHVGRSKAYWSHHFPRLQKTFKKQLSKVSLNKFYRGINKIKPNLIRTEADELHYHYHILIRYELEKKMIEGKLNAERLRSAWNAAYKKYIGVTVPDDNRGVLQDIHWAHGSFGYFPTYSIGSFYAAQFYHQASQEIKNLDKKLSKGKTEKLLAWLRKKIHIHGRRYNANEICSQITGEELNFKYFEEYATKKFSEVYS